MHAELATQSSWLWLVIPVVIILFFCLVLPSIRVIGPTEVGLVIKRFSRKKLSTDCPIAFGGEAGYQARPPDAGLAVEVLGGLQGRRNIPGCRCRPARSAW